MSLPSKNLFNIEITLRTTQFSEDSLGKRILDISDYLDNGNYLDLGFQLLSKPACKIWLFPFTA